MNVVHALILTIKFLHMYSWKDKLYCIRKDFWMYKILQISENLKFLLALNFVVYNFMHHMNQDVSVLCCDFDFCGSRFP